MKKENLQINCNCGKLILQNPGSGRIKRLCEECKIKHRQDAIKKSNAKRIRKYRIICPKCFKEITGILQPDGKIVYFHCGDTWKMENGRKV